MKKSYVRRKVSELEDRAIETKFARSVMHKIKCNKLFRLIQSEMERIKVVPFWPRFMRAFPPSAMTTFIMVNTPYI